jgi:hypothetical protein
VTKRFTYDTGLLRQVGEAIYGEDWISPLARELGMSVRNMQRYATGTRGVISPALWRDIRRVARDHSRELSARAVYLLEFAAAPSPGDPFERPSED